MSVVRTPISLKFEDDTSSFYLNLIEPLKENRGLSTFIMDLLKLYYEKEEVRMMLEEFRNANGPLAEIQKQISRIAMSHQKTMTTTGMLSDLMAEAENGVTGGAESSTGFGDGTQGDSMAQKVERLEKTVPEIENKVDKVLEIVSTLSQNGVSGNNTNIANQSVVANTSAIPQTTYQNVQTVQPVAQVQQPQQVVQAPIEQPVMQPQVQNVQYDNTVNSTPTVAQPEVVMSTVNVQPVIQAQPQQVDNNAPVIQTAPIIDANAPVIDTNAPIIGADSGDAGSTPVKKAGSFGKLMGSLKK